MSESGTADELFAHLPAATRRTLEQSGLGLPELRRIAAEDGGERRVRHIISEFSPGADSRGPAGDGALRRWMRLLVVAVAGVVVCLSSTYVIGPYSLLVGVAWVPAVAWAGFWARSSWVGTVAYCFVGVSYVVLILVGSGQTDQWYLHLRGQKARVTYVQPERSESHGVSSLYCRVRLPDGSVRQVLGNDKRCTHEAMIGTTTRAVIDPEGHYRPFLGDRSALRFGFWDYLSLGAAAVLVLVSVTAAVLSGVNEARGARRGRVIGTAA